jgi:hypothetical protein
MAGKPGPRKGERHSGQFIAGYDPKRRTALSLRTGEEFRSLCRDHTAEALGVIQDAMRDPEESTKVRLSCARYIIEQGHGKPVTAMALVTGDSAPLDQMPLGQLDALILRHLGAEKDITPT